MSSRGYEDSALPPIVRELVLPVGLRTPGATLVDVSFTPDGSATDLRLEHSGWQAEQTADHARFAADGGWTSVLEALRAKTLA